MGLRRLALATWLVSTSPTAAAQLSPVDIQDPTGTLVPGGATIDALTGPRL